MTAFDKLKVIQAVVTDWFGGEQKNPEGALRSVAAILSIPTEDGDENAYLKKLEWMSEELKREESA